MPPALRLTPTRQIKVYCCQNCAEKVPEAFMVSGGDGVDEEWGIFCRLCFVLLQAEPQGEA
jgi:hypothetical protein